MYEEVRLAIDDLKRTLAKEYLELKITTKPIYIEDPDSEEKRESMRDIEDKYMTICEFEKVLTEFGLEV